MRPTRDQTLITIAEAMSWRSTCSRSHVGVVIAREGRILSTGYNGAPAGLPHCDHSCDCGGLGSRANLGHQENDPVDPLVHYTDCNSEQPCRIAVHAEANAIAYAARYGMSVEGAELFTTLSPCVPCSMLIIQAGIKRVVYGKEYRLTEGLTLLISADIVVGA